MAQRLDLKPGVKLRNIVKIIEKAILGYQVFAVGLLILFIGIKIAVALDPFGFSLVLGGALLLFWRVHVIRRRRKDGEQNKTQEKCVIQPKAAQSRSLFIRGKDHQHVTATGLSMEKRLEQLETLKSAGLITGQEYQQKRQEILREL